MFAPGFFLAFRLDHPVDLCGFAPATFIFPSSFAPSSHIFCETQALEFVDGLPRFRDDRKTPRSPGDLLLDIAPPLDGSAHKGQAGRVGVLGGSVDYAGAPYYAGMAALRVGAELLYLLTAEEATGPIKSYTD